jgi:hypothetical protein
MPAGVLIGPALMLARDPALAHARLDERRLDPEPLGDYDRVDLDGTVFELDCRHAPSIARSKSRRTPVRVGSSLAMGGDEWRYIMLGQEKWWT